MGPHLFDLPFWALGLGAPKSVSAMGGRFALQDMTTIPDTMEAFFEYPDLMMTWSNQCASSQDRHMKGDARRILISFHGTDGTLRADYGAYELLDDKGKVTEMPLPEKTIPPSVGHQREFLDCVKSREQCSCSVHYHYPLHLSMNLAHLAMDLGRTLQWDADTETVIGDREATRRLVPDYRKPWKMLA
jgi:predicted dehydrogenase